jgi:nitrate/TMAO reductase-like tetraheme cytochrome c subunit
MLPNATVSSMPPVHSIEELLKLVALGCTVVAAAIIVWYLVRRPPLGRVTKVLLLLGLGLLPVLVALTGNIAGYEFTLSRAFCGSCHVMGPYIRDASDPKSQSLAAIHSRNHKFGDQSCYTCHADYEIFGAITTKLTGLKHLYFYITEYAGTGPDGEGGPPIELYKRQDLDKGKISQAAFNQRMNAVCEQCHSTYAATWVEKHGDFAADVRSSSQICIDCHNEIHPTALSRRPGGPKAAKAEVTK